MVWSEFATGYSVQVCSVWDVWGPLLRLCVPLPHANVCTINIHGLHIHVSLRRAAQMRQKNFGQTFPVGGGEVHWQR